MTQFHVLKIRKTKYYKKKNYQVIQKMQIINIKKKTNVILNCVYWFLVVENLIIAG